MNQLDEITPVRLPKARRWSVIVAFEGALALTALGLYSIGWLRNDQGFDSIWNRPFLRSLGLGAVGCLPMLVTLWVFLKLDSRPLRELRNFVATHVRPFFSDFRWWELAILSLWVGFCEELLFRWSLQLGLNERFSDFSPWIGLIVASVVFGLCHAVTITYAVIAIVIGFYLGALMLLTGDVTGPAVAHGLYDWIALIAIQRMGANESGDPGPINTVSVSKDSLSD